MGSAWQSAAMIRSLRPLLFGAVAGIFGLLIGHQSLIELFYFLEIFPFRGYRLDPVGPLGVPFLVNAAFWCALWGALLAAIWRWLPGSTPAIKGVIFGLVFVQALGNWILVPVFKGTAYFHGWNWSWMAITGCFQAGFGLATGVIFDRLRRLG
jgi:hypothetical protein